MRTSKYLSKILLFVLLCLILNINTAFAVTYNIDPLTVNITRTVTTNTNSIRITYTLLGARYGATWHYIFNGGPQLTGSIVYNNPSLSTNLTMINDLVYVQDFTGLQPNTTYLLQCKQVGYSTPGGSVGWDPNEVPWSNYYISTDPIAPGAVTFPTIGSSSVTISWNNYSNPSDTSYTLQRRQYSEWLDVVTVNNISSYTDNGLAQEVTYYYRIRVNNKNGGYTYSNEYSVTTSADPAVAAAKAAKAAAEDARSYSEQAKTSADNASSRTWYTGSYGGFQESVADIAGYIRNSQLPNMQNSINSLQSTVNNIQTSVTSTPPTISVQTVSGATATSGSSINLVISASSNNLPLSYSINGGAYSSLPANGIVSAPVINNGPNAIQVNVKDKLGNVATTTKTIWKLP